MKGLKALAFLVIAGVAILAVACQQSDALLSQVTALEAQVAELQRDNEELREEVDGLTGREALAGARMDGFNVRLNFTHVHSQKAVRALCEVDVMRYTNGAWISYLDWRVSYLEEDPVREPTEEELTTYQGICEQDREGRFTHVKPEIWDR